VSTVTVKLIDEGLGGFDLYESAEGHLFAARAGTKDLVGSAWGPAAEGTDEWFASRWLTETAAIRVVDRSAAVEYITTDPVRH
jgi:hypothetical protein